LVRAGSEAARDSVDDGICRIARTLRRAAVIQRFALHCVVAAKGDFETAFQAYQQVRYLRTGRVQLTARYYGEAYHAAGVTAELRNMMLGNRKPDQAFEGLGWLYDGI
jgi:lipopolysaccharide biosynthesis regulator YciM